MLKSIETQADLTVGTVIRFREGIRDWTIIENLNDLGFNIITATTAEATALRRFIYPADYARLTIVSAGAGR